MTEEMWKTVLEYNKYEISNFGNIRFIKNKKLLKFDKSEAYLRIKLTNNKGRKHFLIHRLVAQAFIPSLINKPYVNHIDGNKRNNNFKNLEWCTKSENAKHAADIGLRKFKGQDAMHHILKNKDIFEIRSLLKSGIKNVDIAKKYKVGPSTISKIKCKKTWVHI